MADHASRLSLPCGASGLRFAPTSLLGPEILQEGQKVRRVDGSPRFQRATSKQQAGRQRETHKCSALLAFCPSDLPVKKSRSCRAGLDPL
jgi:hypothetical protein